MKHLYRNILAAAAATLLLSSCSDFINEALDIDPTDRYSASAVWASEATADQYLIGLYNFIKENSGNVGCNYNLTAVWDAYSDILKSNSWNQYNHPYNTAFLQGESSFNGESAGVFECWSDCYTRIRRCNEFLRDAPVYGPKINATYAETRSAEMKFIRAMTYFKLMRVYGKCIIRDKVDGPEANDKAFATPEQAWAFIEQDLTDAGNGIADGLARGRITKAAAWAMLSRVALYAGHWDTVISAAEKCREEGGALDPSYANVFSNVSSVENLLAVEYRQNKLSHRGDVFFRPPGDAAIDGLHPGANIYAVFNPTSELVDSYEMADGTPFSWSAHGSDPYTGREPRFYATILYNGAKWEGRKIETFEGGVDGIVPFNTSGAAMSTVTGYYLKKFITENEEGWELYGSDHFSPVIRYAEVLLNEAEAYAMKEDFTNALDRLNQVRSRVSLPDRSASDLNTFMEYLRHERTVELAGEGFRFWDLRRWRLAVCEDSEKSVIDGKNFHGCWITKGAGDALTYKQVICDGTGTDGTSPVHFFAERYYAFAIPVTEFSNNGAIDRLKDNNPGW